MLATSRPTACIAALAATACLGTTGVASAEEVRPQATDREAVLDTWNALQCGVGTKAPVTDATPTTVVFPPVKFTIGSMPSSLFTRPPSTNPTWQLNFYSFSWIRPYAKKAYVDGQRRALTRMVDQVDAFYRANPDRGRSVLGWDEGTSLRRLENLNCLYAVSRDARLKARMAQEVQLLFGPRYYGPPRHQVHNHGLMANVRIVQAGRLIGRSDWVSKAGARMRYEADLAFSAKGTSMEQSAKYHIINMNLWNQAAGELRSINPTDPTVARLKSTVARAQVVARWLTEPDGRIVQLGDSTLMAGLRPTGAERPGIFRDDETGFLVGRWSWKDPNRTYYTLRYGPGRWAHGHNDKGSVTWSVAGARVLVDSGYYGFDWSDPLAKRARSPQAHNVSWPLSGTFSERKTATVRGATFTSGLQSWNITDTAYGSGHVRHVAVNDATKAIAIRDTYRGKTQFRQAFHLDPRWVYRGQSGKQLRFSDASGRRLTLTTTGRFVSLKRGSTKPLAGWTHPEMTTKVADWEIVLGGTGTATTTFQVR